MAVTEPMAEREGGEAAGGVRARVALALDRPGAGEPAPASSPRHGDQGGHGAGGTRMGARRRAPGTTQPQDVTAPGATPPIVHPEAEEEQEELDDDDGLPSDKDKESLLANGDLPSDEGDEAEEEDVPLSDKDKESLLANEEDEEDLLATNDDLLPSNEDEEALLAAAAADLPSDEDEEDLLAANGTGTDIDWKPFLPRGGTFIPPTQGSPHRCPISTVVLPVLPNLGASPDPRGITATAVPGEFTQAPQSEQHLLGDLIFGLLTLFLGLAVAAVLVLKEP